MFLRGGVISHCFTGKISRSRDTLCVDVNVSNACATGKRCLFDRYTREIFSWIS